MVDIDLSAKYVFQNDLFGSPIALASTSLNDSLIVQPVNSSGSQTWYFTETSIEGYYRLHTVDKGNYTALDVYNYIGRQTIDVHFYATQDLTGQYWRFNKQNDGSVKLSNNFTGPDIYLDLKDDTLQPMLAGRDSKGQRWTLSSVGSTPTSTNSASSTASPSMSSRSDGAPASTCTSKCLGSNNRSSSKKLSGGVIGGIVGAVLGALLLAGIIIFTLWRRRRRNPPRQPLQMDGKAVLNG